MRKFISLMMVLAMLVSAVAATTVYAGAEMLDGDDGIDYVEAYYFTDAPTIDGYISEAEWGEVTVELQHDWCGNLNDTKPIYNSFFYWKGLGSMDDYPMAANIWLRWDENYFYVGAKVRDYDGHSLRNGKSETWNGDALQFRVDKDGPNSATYGDVYDPAIGTPWYDSTIPDFVAGYVQIAGGFFECFDNTNDKGLTAYSNPVFGAVKIAVAPSEQNSDDPKGYHDDAKAGYTTYEIAIPWKYIFENHKLPNYSSLSEAEKAPYTLKYTEWDAIKEPTGGIGNVLGMSLTIFNAAKGEAAYNAFMSWGSGTTNVQPGNHATCAGSNSVELSATKVTPGSYTKYDPSVLEATRTEKKYDTVFYDYLNNDIQRTNPLSSADDLKVLTYDDDADLDYWGNTNPTFNGTTFDVGGTHGKVLNFDRMTVTKTDDDGTVHVVGVDPIDSFYLDTAIDEELAYTFPLSYTLEFDVMYTGNEIVQQGRASELGNWFGGANAVSYYCGYSFTDKKFIINDVTDPNTWLASKDYDLKVNTWYNWKFQFDNETCTVRLLIDDEVIFNVYNRYFFYSNEQHQSEGTLLVYWFINTQLKMDNVKMYNFYDYVHQSSEEVEDSSTPSVKPPQTQTGGEDIEVEVEEKEDGTFPVSVKVKDEYNKNKLTSLSYTVKFNKDMYEIAELKGLEEADYAIEETDDGVIITIKNLAKVTAAKTGDVLFEIVFKGLVKDATANGLADTLEIKDSYTYTVATGDSMIYVAVIAAVALAGLAVVVYRKKRSF